MRGPAILAHEIKNPLAAIKGASQLLSRRAGVENAQFTDIITEQVERIASLIDRMQALGSGVLEPSRAVNPHPFIRRAVATIMASGDTSCVIDENFDPSIPDVEASPEGLLQILVNLLANAADAVRAEPNGKIIVRTRYVSGLAVTAKSGVDIRQLPVEIAICDNGVGIDAQIVDSVFEPFVSTKKQGQGLGLPLVQKLTHDMGGRVTHMRDDRTGLTEFRLHLPTAVPST
ncbi:MAG: ATP-binding protein [Pontixanthobacter sp.]